MANKDATLMGGYEALYVIVEATPNVTPNAGDWKRIVARKTFNGQMQLNQEPLVSAGSKRFIAYNQGGVYDVPWNFSAELTFNTWLELLPAIFGDALGTTEKQVPTVSILRVVIRDVGGPNEFKYAQLFNGCVVESAIFKKEVGNKPFQMTVSGRAQHLTYTSAFSGLIPDFSAAGFIRPTINSLEALPDPDLRPIMWYDFVEYYDEKGASEIPMPRIGGWEMQITNSLANIPGKVIGADGNQYPVWEAFGTEGQQCKLKFNIVPENYEWWERYILKKWIEKIRLVFTSPPDYGASTNREFQFLEGTWSDPNNIQQSEVTTQIQEMMADFANVLIITT